MLTLLLICMQTWSLTADDSPSIWTLSDVKEVIQSDSFAESRREAAPSLKPLVELWTTANCPPCERMKRDIEGGCLYGCSIVWNRGERPNKQSGFPQCRVNGEAFVGWSESVKGRVRDAAGLDAVVKQSLTTATPVKQLNSNGFDVGKHLRDNHGVSTDGMTLQQMEALHNSLHGWQQGTVSRRPQVRGGILRRWFR